MNAAKSQTQCCVQAHFVMSFAEESNGSPACFSDPPNHQYYLLFQRNSTRREQLIIRIDRQQFLPHVCVQISMNRHNSITQNLPYVCAVQELPRNLDDIVRLQNQTPADMEENLRVQNALRVREDVAPILHDLVRYFLLPIALLRRDETSFGPLHQNIWMTTCYQLIFSPDLTYYCNEDMMIT